MKKLILLIAVVFLFTIFSCTPEEIETKPKTKVEKKDLRAGDPDPDGPGDKPFPPTKP